MSWEESRREIKIADDNFLRNVYKIVGGHCTGHDLEYYESMPISRFGTLVDIHNEAQELSRRRQQESKN